MTFLPLLSADTCGVFLLLSPLTFVLHLYHRTLRKFLRYHHEYAFPVGQFGISRSFFLFYGKRISAVCVPGSRPLCIVNGIRTAAIYVLDGNGSNSIFQPVTDLELDSRTEMGKFQLLCFPFVSGYTCLPASQQVILLGDVRRYGISQRRGTFLFIENLACFIVGCISKKGHLVGVSRPDIDRIEAISLTGFCGLFIVYVIGQLRAVPFALIGIRQYAETFIHITKVISCDHRSSCGDVSRIICQGSGYAVCFRSMQVEVSATLCIVQFHHAMTCDRHSGTGGGAISRAPASCFDGGSEGDTVGCGVRALNIFVRTRRGHRKQQYDSRTSYPIV